MSSLTSFVRARALLGITGLCLAAPPTGDLAAQSNDAATATLEELAARVTPAVVLIDVTTAADARQGSGFLVDSDGRIFTNHHVIRDARTARVKLSSGDVYEEVEVLASDARRDIAILRIAGFDLPFLELGNSDSVRVGSPVVLVGSPLGLENTVSTGIVSGRRQEPEGYQLIQISAPASRGSSGGAVLGARGQVVGIAVSQIGGGQNLNFAVPINYARGLLSHLGDEPLAVLRPTGMVAAESEALPTTATRTNAVNVGLSYAEDDFAGYTMETRVDLEGNRTRRTRMTYRLIETVAGGEPRIERYLESETTQATEPFGTLQTFRRERNRAVVRATDLSPISARGETADWNGTEWVTAEHDLRFDGGRVVGLLSDTTGRVVELDRELPEGIVLQDMRDLAFAVLQADSLVGRSVEFTTFDPRTGRVDQERYDVLDETSVEIAGERYDALEVNVATGLDNETYLVRAQRPRVLLQRTNDDRSEIERVSSLQILSRRSSGTR
jgi:S1-C subfamily serine protease